MRKASFRKSNPMSVFIDVSETQSRGTTLYWAVPTGQGVERWVTNQPDFLR